MSQAKSWLAAAVLSGAIACNGGKSTSDADESVPSDTDTDTTVSTLDGDGDGFAATEDCDDTDPAVNPDADEICDEKDNDCDTFIDLDPVAPLLYADIDLDGFGDPATGVGSCFPLAGHVEDSSDCNDSDATVSPAAEESCNDRDDDCDPLTTEDSVISVNGFGLFATVQAAADAAVNGAVIDLCPGVYNEAVSTGKGMIWKGHGGRDQVFLDAGGFAPTLRITGGLTTTIDGVTLMNGEADFGGCLSVSAGDLTLTGARLSGCSAATGGGLNFSGDQVFADTTEFVNNTASVSGGGIWGGFNSEIRLTDCTVSGNNSTTGGGLFGEQSTDFILASTDIADNDANALGGGLALFKGSVMTMDGGSIVRNSAPDGGGALVNASTLAATATDMGVGADDNNTLDVFVVDQALGYSYDGVSDLLCDSNGCT